MNTMTFDEFLKQLNIDTKNVRKATYKYEKEMLAFLGVDLETFDEMTIIEIKNALIEKRDTTKSL